MNTLRITRKQIVEVNLLREPTIEELEVIEGKDIENTIFDFDGLLDWDNEDVVEEDYSYGMKLIKNNK